MADHLPTPDAGFWEWLVGVVFVAIGGIITDLYRRLNQSEDLARKVGEEAERVARDGHNKIWERMTAHDDAMTKIRADLFQELRAVATKDDLRESEHRIMAAIESRNSPFPERRRGAESR